MLQELKNVTKLFNFKAYEQSFQKLEESYRDLFDQVMKLKADHAFGKEDLAKWKESIIE